MLAVFVATTLEGWVDNMYLYQDTYNWWVSTIYHVMMVLLGAFFCLGLALAVIAGTFENQPRWLVHTRATRARRTRTRMAERAIAYSHAQWRRISGPRAHVHAHVHAHTHDRTRTRIRTHQTMTRTKRRRTTSKRCLTPA